MTLNGVTTTFGGIAGVESHTRGQVEEKPKDALEIPGKSLSPQNEGPSNIHSVNIVGYANIPTYLTNRPSVVSAESSKANQYDRRTSYRLLSALDADAQEPALTLHYS